MRPSIIIEGKKHYLLDDKSEFSLGIGRRFEINGKDIAVFLVGEKIVAFGNVCPHQGELLCRGSVKQSRRIECPAHGWTFELDSGKKVPDGTQSIPVYETVIHEEKVWIWLGEKEEEKEKSESVDPFPPRRSLEDY